ncbi:hypothetical protein [Flavobacterium aestivum]|uniref:hypothetical protein n=1 Tax=Flavobacterium aestivum TaxID=3003257 RepID=UPI002482ABA1|nr:hypothetical protein [Flavobacterium aestivum]
MKTYIFILALFFFACSSNKQLQYDTSNCDFNDKILDIDKTINIEPYKNELYKEGYSTLLENDSIEITVDTKSDGWRKYIINKISNIEKHILYDKKTLRIIHLYSFYNKGNFNIGNEYIYNDQGQVIKTIDHNQYSKYPICYKEIIQSTIKKAGSKFYFQALQRDSLIKNNEREYSWKVYFASHRTKKFEIIKHKFFRIDAKTGKTITEEIVN